MGESSTVQKQIQQDWENREFIEIVSEGIKKIAEFLNDFGELFLIILTASQGKFCWSALLEGMKF